MAINSNLGLTESRSALIEMLKTNIPAVNKHIYPGDVREGAQMPRISVSTLTPTETRVSIGEGFGAYKGLFYNYVFQIKVWDYNPTTVESATDQIFYAVWKNRGYTPLAPNNIYGQFLLLEIAGGSTVEYDAPKNLWRRTINVKGKWLSKSVELF